MQVVDNVSALDRAKFGPIALVPTMGALHEGHVRLIRQARTLTDAVLVSIFINPLQFENPSDLEKYPRTPEADIEKAAQSGAEVLWRPKYEQVYPETTIALQEVGAIASLYEGATRKGHFQGMLTVVRRLFDLVEPKWAIFGEKDFQQLFLVRRMVKDLKLDIEIVAVPTVRESDGLAISSRNVRLSPDDRQAALVISRALTNASQMESIESMQDALDTTLASESEFKCDYAVIIDEEDFSLAKGDTKSKRALIAGWVNGGRLIDNMSMVGLAR